MIFLKAKEDTLGIASCIAFIVSALIFYHVQRNVLFMYPEWDIAFAAPSFVGLVLAILGIGRALRAQKFLIFSVLGVVLNIAPVGMMLFVFAVLSH